MVFIDTTKGPNNYNIRHEFKTFAFYHQDGSNVLHADWHASWYSRKSIPHKENDKWVTTDGSQGVFWNPSNVTGKMFE